MNTKETIILAAIDIFSEKGKYGATMDEIAKKAKVNKAMIYYFFSTRENIYIETVSYILKKIIIDMSDKVIKKIKKARDPLLWIQILVKNHLRTFSENMNYTKILLEALIQNPEEIKKAARALKGSHFLESHKSGEKKRLEQFLEDGIEKGILRKIDPIQTLISIMGMILIYFISKPISQIMLDIDVKNERSFLKKREKSIIDLILHGVIANENSNV